jgi:dienelactone hydrolase
MIEDELKDFIDLESIYDVSLKPTILEKTEIREEKKLVCEEAMSFISSIWRENLIGKLFYPSEERKPFPTVILCHGAAASHKMMEPRARWLATKGYAAFVMDLYPQNIPRDSFVFEDVLSKNICLAIGEIDYLVTREEVDEKKIAIVGDSMGGITSLLTSSLDKRIKACVSCNAAPIPIKSKPNRRQEASRVNERFLSLMSNIGNWVPNIECSTMISAGTNDSFFPLSSIIEGFQIIKEPKAIALIPNCMHTFRDITSGIYLSERPLLLGWLEAHIKATRRIPRIVNVNVSKCSPNTPISVSFEVKSQNKIEETYIVYVEQNIYELKAPEDELLWHIIPTKKSGRTWEATIFSRFGIPSLKKGTDLSFYILAIDRTGFHLTTIPEKLVVPEGAPQPFWKPEYGSWR